MAPNVQQVGDERYEFREPCAVLANKCRRLIWSFQQPYEIGTIVRPVRDVETGLHTPGLCSLRLSFTAFQETLISTSTISNAITSMNLKTIFQFYFVKDFRHIKRPHFTLLFGN